jgi:hypothetical protein
VNHCIALSHVLRYNSLVPNIGASEFKVGMPLKFTQRVVTKKKEVQYAHGEASVQQLSHQDRTQVAGSPQYQDTSHFPGSTVEPKTLRFKGSQLSERSRGEMHQNPLPRAEVGIAVEDADAR